jgi:DNA polymerase III subunit epsilon
VTRSVLLDTETTGLDPALGHRVIEIAAIELSNDLPTGQFFHRVLDPERSVPAEATAIHGLRDADLAGKPRFVDVVPEFVAFLGLDPIIAHNAPFDFTFLDSELARCGKAPLDRRRMIDTLALAKSLFPGATNTLDALCRRFAINVAERSIHNALLDCRLLAAVYVELTGGRQRGLALAQAMGAPFAPIAGPRDHTPYRVVPSAAEQARHAAFVGRLRAPLWRRH